MTGMKEKIEDPIPATLFDKKMSLVGNTEALSPWAHRLGWMKQTSDNGRITADLEAKLRPQ